MGYGELYIPPERKDYNAVNGRFMKGHVPFNKGKKWTDYLKKRSMRKCAKGWANVMKHRPKSRPDVSERCRKQVIAVTDDGRMVVLPSVKHAGEWIGGCRENVRRCCRENGKMHVNRKTGKVNTDHRYMGVRFYYESDTIWTGKISGRM